MMNTYIYISTEIIFLTTIIFFFWKKNNYIKTYSKFIISTTLYLLLILLVIYFFNYLDFFLLNKKIYIELGHASLLNVVIWMSFLIIYLISVFLILLKVIKHNNISSHI